MRKLSKETVDARNASISQRVMRRERGNQAEHRKARRFDRALKRTAKAQGRYCNNFGASGKPVKNSDKFCIICGKPLLSDIPKQEIKDTKVGEEKELTVKYDTDYPDPTFAGAEIQYHCKVKEVKERILPEINDAFAKSTGMGETALEFKIKIREDIQKHKEDGQKRTRRREIIRQICENNQISVPNGLVNEYLDSVVEDYRKQNPQFNEAEVREQ